MPKSNLCSRRKANIILLAIDEEKEEEEENPYSISFLCEGIKQFLHTHTHINRRTLIVWTENRILTRREADGEEKCEREKENEGVRE